MLSGPASVLSQHLERIRGTLDYMLGHRSLKKEKKKVISISAEFNIYGALNEDLEMAVHIR